MHHIESASVWIAGKQDAEFVSDDVKELTVSFGGHEWVVRVPRDEFCAAMAEDRAQHRQLRNFDGTPFARNIQCQPL